MQPKAENFTEKAWATILQAEEIARGKNHQKIESEHLLIALIQGNDFARRMLSRHNFSLERLEAIINQFIDKQPTMKYKPDNIYLGESLDRVISKSIEFKNLIKFEPRITTNLLFYFMDIVEGIFYFELKQAHFFFLTTFDCVQIFDLGKITILIYLHCLQHFQLLFIQFDLMFEIFLTLFSERLPISTSFCI